MAGCICGASFPDVKARRLAERAASEYLIARWSLSSGGAMRRSGGGRRRLRVQFGKAAYTG
jgi:hypothetical protein